MTSFGSAPAIVSVRDGRKVVMVSQFPGTIRSCIEDAGDGINYCSIKNRTTDSSQTVNHVNGAY